MQDATNRLACQSCQRRKIKCDREVPCSACRAGAIQCIPVISRRLPRGMSGGRRKQDEVLGARIAKLEGLLADLHAPSQGAETLPTDNNMAGSSNNRSHAQAEKAQYLGGAFWTSLEDELRHIQGAFEQGHSSSSEPIDDLADDASTPDRAGDLPSPIVDVATGIFVPSVLLQVPPPVLKRELCASFFANVDPVFKVLHAPSVRAHIEEGAPYLDYEQNSSAVKALTFVLYYGAISTMTERQCIANVGQSKKQAIRQYRVMAEAALVQAEYVVSTDLASLQAFVLYLAMLRHEDRSRRCWTLITVAVRIAFAIGLHSDKGRHDVFTTEQRRRLWHQIRVLDLQLAVDLASDPLILPGTHDTTPASNINDVDLLFGSSIPISPQCGWTDMTFSLMTQHIAAEAVRTHLAQADTWQSRQEIILALDHELQTRYLVHCNPSIPFHVFTIAVGKCYVKACLLHAIRPTSARSSTIAPPINSDYVLSLAVDTLAMSQECTRNPLMEGWRWTLWVQWHALAVAFASLGFITVGDLADRAWVVAEAALSDFARLTANGQQTQLMRPLDRLVAKARRARSVAPPHSHIAQSQVDRSDTAFQQPAAVTAGSLMMDETGMLTMDPSLPIWNPESYPGFGVEDGVGGWGVWQEFLETFPDPMNL